MGYSCTAKANTTLEQISKSCISQTGQSNVWIYKDSKYFWEIGREQRNGAITGRIMKITRMDSIPTAIRIGTFRISPDGTIERSSHGFKELYKE